MKYSFLYGIASAALNERANDVTVHPYGKYAELLSSDDNSTEMKFVDMYHFVNTDPVEFTYKKRKRPNTRWPWPLRLWPKAPTVVVEGCEIRSYENGTLLFDLPVSGIPHYLRPGDTAKYDVGQIRIDIG